MDEIKKMKGLTCRVKSEGIECISSDEKVSNFKEMHVFVPCEPEHDIKENEPTPSQEAKQ